MIVWNEFRNDARVLKEAETLQSVGHKVTVFALHTPGVTQEHEALTSGVNVVRVARSPFWKWRKRRVLSATGAIHSPDAKVVSGPIGKISLRRRILRVIARLWTHIGLLIQMIRARPDIVHAHDVNTLPTAWLASILTRSLLVYDAHEISTDREGYASFRVFVGWVEKHLMPRANGTITTTDIRAKFFVRAYGICRPLVLQNRPRLTRIERSQRIREVLQLDQPWPIVLYQGGLQQGRGLERLVDVAAHVKNAYFVFIGGGRLEVTLKDLVRSRQLESCVHFIPTVSLQELPFYTASADIGVQPIENTCLNHFSTDSNKLFEYVVAGLPVVVSRLPEMRKVVRTHDLGILVQPGSKGELVAALQKLVADSVLREQYRSNALRAAKKLNWEEQEHRLVKLYENILSGVAVCK